MKVKASPALHVHQRGRGTSGTANIAPQVLGGKVYMINPSQKAGRQDARRGWAKLPVTGELLLTFLRMCSYCANFLVPAENWMKM